MTELEKMEAELKELQGKIKRYKEEQSPHFNMSLVDDSIAEDCRVCCEPMKNGLRLFMKYMTTLTVKTNLCGQYISTAFTVPKMCDIEKDKIHICNEFLMEIQPIVKKYSQIFMQMNSKGGSTC